MKRVRLLSRPPAAEPLLRAANDSLRPLSTVELALLVRPAAVKAGTEPVWSLDPRYGAWLQERYPRDPIWFCPLADYDAQVRGAEAPFTLEEMHARLEREVEETGGYRLAALNGWRRRTAMFAVGSLRLRALTDFLFAWG